MPNVFLHRVHKNSAPARHKYLIVEKSIHAKMKRAARKQLFFYNDTALD
jgi:hypothetical protein